MIEIDAFNIELYLGETRSGKTLTMVAETYEQTKDKPHIPIFSNLKLNRKYFPTYEYINMDDLKNYHKNKDMFRNCIILLDELHIIMDSRKFMGDESKQIGYFLGQLGKRGNVLRGTTHFPKLIDVRLRRYCERWVYIRKGLLEYEKYWTPILNNNRLLSKEENKKLLIKAESVIRKLVDYNFVYKKQKTKWIKALNYFDMYDTYELVAK